MNLSDILYNFIEETGEEIKKEKNMDLLRSRVINPVIKEIIDELYPYIVKLVVCSVFFIIILLITIVLNIKVILKN
jgi:hypothetical protein